MWSAHSQKQVGIDALKALDTLDYPVLTVKRRVALRFHQQYWMLLMRFMRGWRRDPVLILTRLGQAVFLFFVLGTLWWQLDTDQSGASLRVSAIS